MIWKWEELHIRFTLGRIAYYVDDVISGTYFISTVDDSNTSTETSEFKQVEVSEIISLLISKLKNMKLREVYIGII